MSNSPIINSIQEKIDRLIAENRGLRNEREKLVGENNELKIKNRELIEDLAEQDDRIAVLELKKSFAAGGENQRLARARVNRLVREVDKCLALLNREEHGV